MFGILYMTVFSIPREDVQLHGYITKVVRIKSLGKTTKY